jgi:hypothetical protein
LIQVKNARHDAPGTKEERDLVNITQLVVGLPVGLALLWAVWLLHRRMFRRPGERMSVLDAAILVVMGGMALLLALSLATAVG